MSRPLKKQLDYFPLDCEFDSQFKALQAVHGNDGTAWMIHFWQCAYKNEKGHVDANGAKGVFLGENSRITQGKQREIIGTALELALLYEVEPGIYTSNGIQKRLKTINDMREEWRKKKGIKFSPEKTPGKLRGNAGKTPQSKSESERKTLDSSRPAAQPDKKPRERNQFFDFVAETWGINPDAAAPRIQKLASTFKILLDAEGSPLQEIKRRKLEFENRWPKMASTPEAVSKHWADLKGKPSAAPLPVFKETKAKTGGEHAEPPIERAEGLASVLSALDIRRQA